MTKVVDAFVIEQNEYPDVEIRIAHGQHIHFIQTDTDDDDKERINIIVMEISVLKEILKELGEYSLK